MSSHTRHCPFCMDPLPNNHPAGAPCRECTPKHITAADLQKMVYGLILKQRTLKPSSDPHECPRCGEPHASNNIPKGKCYSCKMEELGQVMVNPIRRVIDYQGLSREFFGIKPPSDTAIYKKDE